MPSDKAEKKETYIRTSPVPIKIESVNGNMVRNIHDFDLQKPIASSRFMIMLLILNNLTIMVQVGAWAMFLLLGAYSIKPSHNKPNVLSGAYHCVVLT